jgi:hypothetical protein
VKEYKRPWIPARSHGATGRQLGGGNAADAARAREDAATALNCRIRRDLRGHARLREPDRGASRTTRSSSRASAIRWSIVSECPR